MVGVSECFVKGSLMVHYSTLVSRVGNYCRFIVVMLKAAELCRAADIVSSFFSGEALTSVQTSFVTSLRGPERILATP